MKLQKKPTVRKQEVASKYQNSQVMTQSNLNLSPTLNKNQNLAASNHGVSNLGTSNLAGSSHPM